MDIKKVLKFFKSHSRKVVIFDITEDQAQVLTTEPISSFPSAFGRAAACATNAIYESGNKKYSRQDILHAILSSAVPTAERVLQELEEEESSPNTRRSASG